MKKLFTLGELPISDFVKESDKNSFIRHDLQLVLEEDTGLIRLETTAPLNAMFGKYFYQSGINEKMVNELKNIVDSILPLMKFKENHIFCDIASNDGTLLSFVPKQFIRIGIDPAELYFKQKAEKHANLIIQDFFSAEIFKKSIFGDKKIKVLTAIAVFYDVENPDKFLQDAYEVLDDEGLFVIQLSHSGLMIKQFAFDNILSEHVLYLTLNSLKVYLERNGFCISDCQLNDTNGGSFRVYIRKKIADEKLFATQPYRDVCNYRIESLLNYEKLLKLDEEETWMKFYDDIQKLKKQVVGFIKDIKEMGLTIWAYAASTKGNTLLNYFELDSTLIEGVAERNIDKWGLYTVGSNIKIYSEDEFRKANPDYTLILAWHFVQSFIERESEYLKNGGHFIIPMPKFMII